MSLQPNSAQPITWPGIPLLLSTLRLNWWLHLAHVNRHFTSWKQCPRKTSFCLAAVQSVPTDGGAEAQGEYLFRGSTARGVSWGRGLDGPVGSSLSARVGDGTGGGTQGTCIWGFYQCYHSLSFCILVSIIWEQIEWEWYIMGMDTMGMKHNGNGYNGNGYNGNDS